MMPVPVLLGLFLVGTVLGSRGSKMNEVFAWKFLDYNFPVPELREELLASGKFKLHRSMPMGLEVWRDKLFLTVPRRKDGVPAVLGYINLNSTERSPLLTPYPDWTTHTQCDAGKSDNSTRLTTAYRIRADACDRLWIIDTGLADIGNGFGPLSTPKIVIYNLLDDTLFLEYNLRDSDFTTGSFFANIAVDVTADTCDDAFAYIPDLGAHGLVVFSLKDKDSWRIKHSYLYFDPLATDFNIDGINFQLNDGAFSSALSGIKEDGYRTLYFHSLSSYNEFAVSTRILRNKDLANKSFHEFKYLGTRGLNSQSTGTFFDEKTGVLFLLEVQNHAVTCWNTAEKPSMPGHIGVVATDKTSRAFIYPCDVKVDRDDNLWVLSNNIPRYIFSDLDIKEYNYFVLKTYVRDAIKGTVCDIRQSCRCEPSHHFTMPSTSKPPRRPFFPHQHYTPLKSLSVHYRKHTIKSNKLF